MGERTRLPCSDLGVTIMAGRSRFLDGTAGVVMKLMGGGVTGGLELSRSFWSRENTLISGSLPMSSFWGGLAETVLKEPKLLPLFFLDFCLKFDLTVTRTGFWVVVFTSLLFSFRLFFTTSFLPFLSFITTFPILFDFLLSSSFSSMKLPKSLSTLLDKLFSLLWIWTLFLCLFLIWAILFLSNS